MQNILLGNSSPTGTSSLQMVMISQALFHKLFLLSTHVGRLKKDYTTQPSPKPQNEKQTQIQAWASIFLCIQSQNVLLIFFFYSLYLDAVSRKTTGTFSAAGNFSTSTSLFLTSRLCFQHPTSSLFSHPFFTLCMIEQRTKGTKGNRIQGAFINFLFMSLLLQNHLAPISPSLKLPLAFFLLFHSECRLVRWARDKM